MSSTSTIRPFVDPQGDHHIVVPRLIGDVSRVPPGKRRPERYDRTSLLTDLARQGEDKVAAGTAVVDWIEAHSHLRLRWTRAADGMAETGRGRRNVVRVWPSGWIEVHLKNLELLGDGWGRTDSSMLMDRLAARTGLAFSSTEWRWPKAPMRPLADDGRRDEFFSKGLSM